MAIDQQVVALAKAIRQHESGNTPVAGQSGELASRYQFTAGTWKNYAQQILGNPKAPITLENENKVAYYKILNWKKQGYNPAQIASMWNAGEGRPNAYKEDWRGVNDKGVAFDTPAYAKSVYELYKQYRPEPVQEQKVEPQVPQEKILDKQSAEMYNPTFFGKEVPLPIFPANTENPSFWELAKEIGNMPASLYNLGKGIVEFLNPVNAGKAWMELGTEYGKNYEELKQGDPTAVDTWDVLAEVVPALYSSLPLGWGKQLLDGIGAEIKNATNEIAGKEIFDVSPDKVWDEFQREIVNNPAGILPAVLMYRGYIEGTPQAVKFDETVSRVAKPVIEGAKKAKDAVGKTTRFTTAQTTGFQPETISQIIRKPEAFSESEMAIRGDRFTLAEKVKSALSNRLAELKDTGKAYDAIKQQDVLVKVNQEKIAEVFDSYGIKFDEAGKVIRTPETRASAGDARAIEDFMSVYGKEPYLSSTGFLNTRSALADMAKYDVTAPKSISAEVARDLRIAYNSFGRTQIKGLKALDAKYFPEVKQLNKLKKEYLDKEGNLKDGVINKIANLGGKGKDLVLNRLEKIYPNILEEVRILKAIEDIQTAGGHKVGTYLRASITGGLVATGNPVIALLQMMASQPRVVVPLLRMFGTMKGIPSKVMDGIINKLKKGKSLNSKEKGIVANTIDEFGKMIDRFKQKTGIDRKLGLGIEDITKSDPLYKEATKYKTPEEFVKAQTKPHYINIEDIKSSLDADTFSELKGIPRNQNINLLNEYKSLVKRIEKSPVGREITKPISIEFNAGGGYRILDGNNRYLQAIKNGDKKILAKFNLPKGTSQESINIFNNKTKSQLIDIWNKANKGKNKPDIQSFNDAERDMIIRELKKYKENPKSIKAFGLIEDWLKMAEKGKLVKEDLVDAYTFLVNEGVIKQ